MSSLVRAAAFWLLGFAFWPAALLAQHVELASNDDGSVLYVTSYSVLRESAVATHPQTRLYRIGADGVQLFAETGPPPVVNGVTSFSSSDGISIPQVSDDGLTVAYTARGVCTGDPCVIGSAAFVKGATSIQLGAGAVQMSRNARWAVVSAVPTLALQPKTADLIDLSSGQHTTVPAPAVVPFAIAGDGSILVLQGSFGIWKEGQFTSLSLGDQPVHVFGLSDNAQVLVYSVLSAPPPATGGVLLKARNLASGRDTTLFQADTLRAVSFMSMSDDGRLALYGTLGVAALGPAFLADTSTGETAELSLPDGEIPVTGTLSGDGNTAFIATTAGRILKFKIQGLATTSETLIAPTPDAGHTGQFPVGSLHRLRGYLPGSAGDLRGRILLDGQPVPVFFVDSNGVAVQVPWEQHYGDVPFRLDIASDSPFIQYELVGAVPLAPAFEPLDPGESAILPIKLIKGDFSGLVTSPPQPFDIVIAYLTGLGPVSGQPQTAIPAPLDSLMPLNGSFTCTFSQQPSSSGQAQSQSPAETLFVGLAPGLIGIYQVAFRMPADAGQGRIFGITCQLTTPLGGGTLSLFLLGGS